MPRKRYRALMGMSYLTDPKVIARLLAGEDISQVERRTKEVAVGEIVDDIPVGSVGWLLAQGCIEEVSDGEVRE